MDTLGARVEAVTMFLALCLWLPSHSVGQEGDSGFEKLPPPKEGDWLYVHEERGQTFEQYKATCRNRKTADRNVIYIQPLGEIGRTKGDLIETLREYLSIFFDCRTMVLDSVSLPQRAFHPKRRFGWDQYDADYILGMLSPRAPRDSLSMAGITDQDLFCGDMNFVFGLGSFSGRAGVYSICRYSATYPGQPSDCTLLKRTLKVANHEIGHILSMEHCIFYRCTMNGSNSLPEADSRPIHLCPICLKKLEWNTGFDRLQRYKKLRDFYDRIGLKGDAAFVAAQIVRLEKRTSR